MYLGLYQVRVHPFVNGCPFRRVFKPSRLETIDQLDWLTVHFFHNIRHFRFHTSVLSNSQVAKSVKYDASIVKIARKTFTDISVVIYVIG